MLLRQAESATKSPIEHRLLATLLFEIANLGCSDFQWGFCGHLFPDLDLERLKTMAHVGQTMLSPDQLYYMCIGTQCKIGRYKADIAIEVSPARGAPLSVVVECDGHDFHERTKEQAVHDKQRDRYFQALGLVVLRFTGSEIFKSAADCSREVVSLIFDRMAESI